VAAKAVNDRYPRLYTRNMQNSESENLKNLFKMSGLVMSL
jgi:hypothetical protein